jgi:hypothetical protein
MDWFDGGYFADLDYNFQELADLEEENAQELEKEKQQKKSA